MFQSLSKARRRSLTIPCNYYQGQYDYRVVFWFYNLNAVHLRFKIGFGIIIVIFWGTN